MKKLLKLASRIAPYLMLALAWALALYTTCAHAQTMYVYPASVTAPRGAYQTITAVVTGVNNKTVTWTTTGGTLVGTNPCVVNEPCTIALFSSSAGGPFTVTATTNAGHVTATATVTFAPSPTPRTDHPRLGGITTSTISALRAKAVTGNTLYNSGLLALANTAYANDTSLWSWTCTGGNGQPFADQTASYTLSGPKEYDAYLFAYMANLEPANPSKHWGCYAHDIFLYMANYWLNPLNLAYTGTTLPYRQVDANYGLTGNHGSDETEAYTLTPDWLLGASYLGAGSGATLSATLSGGTMNTPTVSAGGSGYLASADVYWLAPVGSSGCASIGDYGNGFGTGGGSNNGVPMAAYGVVQTNSSGVVAGTVTVLKNATGCTSAPAITIKSDQDTIHDFLAMSGQQMIAIPYTGTRAPVGGYNSSAQFDTGSALDFTGMRGMGNNYTHSKMMYLVSSWLTFNDTTPDDPALPNTCSATRYVVCPDGSAGSLHAYGTYFTGGMLYRDWPHFEDPNVSWQAYQAAYANLPSQPMCDDATNNTSTIPRVPCFGDGRDGESAEGSWYQYSFYRLELAMLSLHSAGVDDPLIYGPQMSLPGSSWWDAKLNSDLNLLTYSYYTPQPRFAYFSTGDTLNLYRLPSDFNTQAWMMVYDSLMGRSDRTSKEEWPALYTSVGGLSTFYTNLNNGNGFVNAIPLFAALPSGDPTSSPPADPRTSLPLDIFSGNNQHIFARSGWVSNGPVSPSWSGSSSQTVFRASCQNSRIDHEHETCGSFDVLSNGEYITKQRTVFNDYNMFLATAEHSNEAGWAAGQSQTACTLAGGCAFAAAIQGVPYWSAQSYVNGSVTIPNGTSTYWRCTGSPCLSTDVPGTAGDWVTTTTTKGGGQLWHQTQAGNATMNHSELPAYVAFNVDTTRLFSGSAVPILGWGSITGVTSASRSLVHLRGANQVITYDRGAGAQYSRDWMTTTGAISIASNVASWTTRSGGQKAYLTSLLPSSPTISNAGAYNTNENGVPGTSDWEPYSHVLIDAGSPSSTQFLSVLEWGPTAFTPSSPTNVTSTAGQAFDGVLTAGETTVVMFMRGWPATFTGTTYPASGALTHYVSDLSLNTTYTISASGAPATATTDAAGVLKFASDGTGNVVISTGGTPTAATPTPSPGPGTYVGPQAVALSTTAGTVMCFNFTGAPATDHATGCGVGSTLYSGPITVSSSSTLYFVAGGTGYLDSPVGSATYTITSPAAATPTFFPVAGTYPSTQSVTLACSTASPTMYYTTDGSTPTTGSTVYSAAISVSSTTAVKAICTAPGFTTSAVGSALYTITPPTVPGVTITNATISGSVVIQ